MATTGVGFSSVGLVTRRISQGSRRPTWRYVSDHPVRFFGFILGSALFIALPGLNLATVVVQSVAATMLYLDTGER